MYKSSHLLFRDTVFVAAKFLTIGMNHSPHNTETKVLLIGTVELYESCVFISLSKRKGAEYKALLNLMLYLLAAVLTGVHSAGAMQQHERRKRTNTTVFVMNTVNPPPTEAHTPSKAN